MSCFPTVTINENHLKINKTRYHFLTFSCKIHSFPMQCTLSFCFYISIYYWWLGSFYTFLHFTLLYLMFDWMRLCCPLKRLLVWYFYFIVNPIFSWTIPSYLIIFKYFPCWHVCIIRTWSIHLLRILSCCLVIINNHNFCKL